MPITDITARYLNSLEDDNNGGSPPKKMGTPISRSNSPTKFKKSDKHEDLDALARALNITPSLSTVTTKTTTSLLRSKFESPSATVSSFKSSDSSIGSSPKKNHFEVASDETPSWANKNYKDVLKRSPNKLTATPLKPLKQPIDTPSTNRPFLSSPSNNASKDSPGYEYLCRIEAIKLWLEQVMEEEIKQSASELIAYIRNGIYLAKLANVILPNERNVFMNDTKLQFKHTENINRFFQLLDFLNMPDLFRFELTDLYDAKNVPKVWFCLHALSYILNKQDSRYPKMGNLVGIVDFEDDDIRSANRALVSAPLPNFSGAHGGDLDETDGGTYMKKVTSPVKKIASPIKRPEFVPKVPSPTTPKIKDDDPFMEEEDATPDQPSIEPELQFKIRLPIIFETTDKLSDYYTPELDQHITNIIKFQSLARGAVFRYSMFVDRILLKSYEDEFTTLFSVIRGNLARAKTVHKHRDDLRAYAFEITELQSLIRKKFVTAKKPDLTGVQMTQFQCLVRGKLQRDRMKYFVDGLAKATPNVITLQSLIRMKKIFSKTDKVITHKDEILPSLIRLQSIVRLHLYHRSAQCKDIDVTQVVALQSIIRRNAVIDDLSIKLSQVRSNKRKFIELQSIARGGITRTRLCKNVLVTLIYEDGKLNELFAKVRGNNAKRVMNHKKQQLLKYEESSVIPVQSLCRGLFARVQKVSTIDRIYNDIESLIAFQSIARGTLVRRLFYEFDDYYRTHIKQVIKAQAVLKRIFDQNAYRSLISSKNPSLDVIRRFLPLLSNRDRDFEEEVALSAIKDSIIDKCRINEDLENQIQQLDMKLALLDKNKISIEEFTKPTSRSYKPVVENVKSLERLTKSSKKRLELYQSLFYFLQTNPVYFTKLYNSMAYDNKDSKYLKDLFQLIVQVFPVRDSSISAHSREEFFFVKLILLLMRSDIGKSRNVGDITKAHLTHWIEFLMDFNNHSFQRQHLKSICGKFVIRLVDNDQLDFESDPSRIYDNIVAHEIKVHGFSNRPREMSPQAAIQLPEVSGKFVNNLVALRESSSELLDVLESNMNKIPDHIRLLCRQSYLMSQTQFPDKSEQQHLAVAGVIFIKHYIGPILRSPEKFGISAKGAPRSPDNLRQLYRVMLQLFSMKIFNDDFLKPLNEYISAVVTRIDSIIRQVIDVDNEIESVYGFNDYDDIVTHQRPKLAMSTSSINQLEKIIQQNLDTITAGNDDQLYKICTQLNNLTYTSEDVIAFAELSTVVLNLAANTAEEPVIDSKTRTLFMQAKRCLLYIIRVQQGDDLLELLISGIKPIHERIFEEEKAAVGLVERKSKSFYNTPLGGDISTMSYHDLKRMCLEIILKLESMGELTRRNSFQELLNQIATDIKTKDTQRKLRREHLVASEKTIRKLTEKEHFLRRQLHDYNKHVESVLGELQSKPKDKKIFNIIPVFSKQYFYLRELRKRNRLPKFGSYKYSAKKLMDQKVLIDYALNASSASKLDFMFSCHQAGKFTVEVATGTVTIPGAANTITLDDLLAMQYEKKRRFDMFDGKVTFDLDNFMGLIFRKFYDIKND
ncbi:Ras GTPase-activating-like protein IQG1 [Candida viswanathii]|uniref:Ras GTPase-activating-like protein IQG1 n=1 Tax=Candida viswanathii TaxID=5486 RepID=A0A367YIK9_9ASCO|nr:Ras GTPase-activating-like protein IQG1 [Candida viswanathii]